MTKVDYWKPGTSKTTPAQKIAVPSIQKSPHVSTAKPSLSKGVLSMKFMKQKEVEATKKQEQAENTKKQEIETPSTHETGVATVVNSENWSYFATLPGRRSFNGCNKAVERYYENRMEELNYKKKKEKTTNIETISDEDMIKKYENLIGLPRGPNQGQRPAPKPSVVNQNQPKSMNKTYKREIDSNGSSSNTKKPKRK